MLDHLGTTKDMMGRMCERQEEIKGGMRTVCHKQIRQMNAAEADMHS